MAAGTKRSQQLIIDVHAVIACRLSWIRYFLIGVSAVALALICASDGAAEPLPQFKIFFSVGSSRLPAQEEGSALDEIALRLKQGPDLRAQITGYARPDEPHAAPDGPYASAGLAERRAQSVKNYLVTRHGIDPARITTLGKDSSDAPKEVRNERCALVSLSER